MAELFFQHDENIYILDTKLLKLYRMEGNQSFEINNSEILWNVRLFSVLLAYRQRPLIFVVQSETIIPMVINEIETIEIGKEPPWLSYSISRHRRAKSELILPKWPNTSLIHTRKPSHAIETFDLWQTPFPEFDGATIDAKYRILHGETHTAAEAAAWNTVEELFNHFNSADKYVFSLPMWNFGVPYKLKHYIDIITQPGLSFSFTPETGYNALVTRKPAAVIYARGGEYSSSEAAVGMDFQKRYLEMWLGFIGFTDITSILLEPTLSDPSDLEKALNLAFEKAAALARRF